ncbi:transcription-repair coupling factor [Carnobacteriaceae bacterium zg-ZUI252]|nr:transcription-repair coupling factor [Carnobacteriaceae bacterium zg-ZUI252]
MTLINGEIMSTGLEQFKKVGLQQDGLLVTGLSGSAKVFAVCETLQQKRETVVYITPNMLSATQAYDDFNQMAGDLPVMLYPVEESVFAQYSVASPELKAQRIQVLHFLLSNEPGIVIVPQAGVTQLLSPVENVKKHNVQLSVGQDYDVTALQRQLIEMGYHKEAMVESPGQFSVRGGIVDIYELSSDTPLRIEFFDIEIDSIRQFDPQTQKSIQTLQDVTILPAREIVWNADSLKKASTRLNTAKDTALTKIKDEQVASSLDVFLTHLATRLSLGELPENVELYTDILFEKPATLLDYASNKALIIIDDYARIIEQDKAEQMEVAEFLTQKVNDAIALPTQQLKKSIKEVLLTNALRKIYLSHLSKGLGRLKFSQIIECAYRSVPQFFSQMPLIKTELERLVKQGYTVTIPLSDHKRVEKVAAIFDDFGMSHVLSDYTQLTPQTINLVVGPLHNGFELPQDKFALFTDRELFNKVTKSVAKRQNLNNAERLKSYSELSVGDYVVHVSHGVGQYKGMETLDINGVKQDYMSIVYQDGASLFIPVTQIHLVQKYVASDGKDPKVNKLGGTEWAKTKKKVAKKIEDIADELIALYAEREKQVGFAFSKDDTQQREFEASFAYAETPDQLRSVAEIKKDMESNKPMDRLLVGDVGYGKTEVAIRAMFKAVQDGKQVAVLVPTTVLAQQHFMTLQQRFENYPVNIGLLSRFRTKKQQDETIERLKKGTVDIVVGTHRVVSKDVDFKDLGLVVIDEEQRFGVKHKERLKQLKTQVDVLTLTATPIPRTLHMSMLGVRDLSVIETPPANRFPVQTYVLEHNWSLVKDGIERELARNGQVFYLHNRVDTITKTAETIRNLVPQARVAHAHGQMSELELENVLMDFMNGVYDVLVTTTIIETGIDLPNVNTLFIEHADRMGLSQLYQLRGRVGRTNRIAYAYFMYQEDKAMSETGEKRLEAIKEFTQLGAGFKIAMRDLSIRGAGNLLGQQQSGFIDSVGFDLYSQMLQEAVEFKKTGVQKVEKSVEIDLGITAYIPSTYVSDERQKIDLYKRIRTIQSVEDYHSLQDDFIDRFGDYPQEVADLMAIGMIKYYAEKQGVEKIKRLGNAIRVTYDKETSSHLTGPNIFEQLSKTKLKASVEQNNQQFVIQLMVTGMESYAYLDELMRYLTID